MGEPDFEAMVKKWCVCAEDYTMRGRTDPECRCDVWQEAIEAAYKQGKRDGAEEEAVAEHRRTWGEP